jgi:hypothetical protein
MSQQIRKQQNQKKQQQIPRQESPTYFYEYVNNMEIAVSKFDLAFKLSRMSGKGQLELGEISLSPQHAKAFLRVLHENIKVYESLFGEIKDQDPTEEQLQSIEKTAGN